MADGPDEATFNGLVKLFKESFPDIHCLRCGYNSFHVLPATRQNFMLGEPVGSPTLLPVTTIACTRCGHIEQHLSEKLRDTPIPIEVEKSGEL